MVAMRQDLVKAAEDPIGLRIKIARLRVGLKQWELAQRIGMSGTELSRIESGAKTARPEILERLWAELEALA
jgi:transcriptional regulator with XRE-family HTH domain